MYEAQKSHSLTGKREKQNLKHQMLQGEGNSTQARRRQMGE
jgi:hypothetical protein